MKKLLAICIVFSVLFLLVAVVAADDMGKTTTVNGFVSDSKCGAKGANAGAAACTKKCIEGGASARCCEMIEFQIAGAASSRPFSLR